MYMNFKFFVLKDENGKDYEVVVVIKFNNKNYRGVAKCHPNDVFDLNFGFEKAHLRASKKVEKARQKLLQAQFDEAARAFNLAQAKMNKIIAASQKSAKRYEYFDKQEKQY